MRFGAEPGATNTVGWTFAGGTSVTKTGLTLTKGTTYYFSLKAVNGIGLESSATNSDGQCVKQNLNPADGVFGNVKVWPNPFVPKSGSPVRFVNLDTDATLKIYTLSGKLVSKLDGVGEITWDGKNTNQESIAPGLYIYVLSDNQGNKKSGKLAISK